MVTPGIGSRKVLAVDDMEDNLVIMSKTFKRLFPHISFITAQSGEEGIQIARKEQPDIILLDIVMPEMDGFETCRVLKTDPNTKHIPVVMVTAVLTDAKSQIKAIENGADAFLSKPLREAEVLTQIRAMLRIKEAEDHLKKEKKLLLREIHHRIKNSLYIVSSLLHLQGDHIQDQKAKDAFRESCKRIQAIALLHEKLYLSTDLTRIEFHQYIRDLTGALIKSFSIPSHLIKLTVDIPRISFTVDTAIPLGLIITEIVTNALKYGFQGEEKLSITIRLKPSPDGKDLCLIVSDSGPGIPEHVDWQNSDTLGIQLVTLLSEQLQGDVQLHRNNGTTFKITFPGLQ